MNMTTTAMLVAVLAIGAVAAVPMGLAADVGEVPHASTGAEECDVLHVPSRTVEVGSYQIQTKEICVD